LLLLLFSLSSSCGWFSRGFSSRVHHSVTVTVLYLSYERLKRNPSNDGNL
jgi:hypothetical protein